MGAIGGYEIHTATVSTAPDVGSPLWGEDSRPSCCSLL
jgi:hypothetical protein